MNQPELISINDAKKRFDVGRQTIVGWIQRGLIQRYDRKIGKVRVFVDAHQIEELLRANMTEPD